MKGVLMMEVKITNGEMTKAEILGYVKYIKDNNPKRDIQKLNITICDNDEVELEYTFVPVPIERIRRITGYLVGTIDRWNDAKAAEEHDRVKHAKFDNALSNEMEMEQIV